MTTSTHPKRERLLLETLESKRLLVAFGIPWADSSDLTVSFPSDGVQVGQAKNEIHAALDATADSSQWQELVLRAYQTWAMHADINVGLRNDNDLAFGTPGLSASDPRFGDFRIAAIPQQDGLANALPFQAAAGTYSGDLLLNSNETFSYHDWQDGSAPVDPVGYDLFSVLLHETGNTLGLADNQTDSSVVMFGQYTQPKGLLQPEDIAQIQQLYGERQDPFEIADNGTMQSSSILQLPVGMDPASDVARFSGSIVNPTDVDFYEFDTLADQSSVQVTVRTRGVSLLNGRLEILDASGAVLFSGTSDSVFDNDISANVAGLENHGRLYVRVSAADSDDVYSVGDYELHLDYRSQSVRESDFPIAAYDGGADSLFTDFDLVDSELVVPQSSADADSLDDYGSFGARSAFSSLGGGDDVDLWHVPSSMVDEGGKLRVVVFGIGENRPDLQVSILDSEGGSVGVAGRMTSEGTWVLNVAGSVPQEYFVRVSVDPDSATDAGNYVVLAEPQTPSGSLHDLAKGELSDGEDNFIRWSAYKSRLFRFDLESQADSDEAVLLTIYDAHTREIRATYSARGVQTRTALIWLEQGDYILRFSAITIGSPDQAADLSYQLRVDGLSDDQADEDGEGDSDNGYEYTVPDTYAGYDLLLEYYYYFYEIYYSDDEDEEGDNGGT